MPVFFAKSTLTWAKLSIVNNREIQEIRTINCFISFMLRSFLLHADGRIYCWWAFLKMVQNPPFLSNLIFNGSAEFIFLSTISMFVSGSLLLSLYSVMSYSPFFRKSRGIEISRSSDALIAARYQSFTLRRARQTNSPGYPSIKTF
jgi:hypothetical protein